MYVLNEFPQVTKIGLSKGCGHLFVYVSLVGFVKFEILELPVIMNQSFTHVPKEPMLSIFGTTKESLEGVRISFDQSNPLVFKSYPIYQKSQKLNFPYRIDQR